MVSMLDLFSGHYWARVAGLDAGKPARENGHDEFAARWTQEMVRNLHGLPVSVIRRTFATPGFRSLPASRPGVNILVVVPGSRHPDQAVIVGSHYDGEPFSRGSAYDDTSGSMITLALARSLDAEWRAHGLPGRTVEFALFDGEEQGLTGSTAFAFDLRHGALMPRPVFMIDEEQSGIGYPARPFGLLSRSPMPGIAATTGTLAPLAMKIVGPVTPANPKVLALAQQRVIDARASAFHRLQRAYPRIPYRGGDAAAFAPGDEAYVQTGPDVPICCSDNAPFEALGLPTVTLSGDYHYYEQGHASWSFPFDQPQDSLGNMACDTAGSSRPGAALQAALNLELVMSSALVDSYAPPGHGQGVAVFSTVPGAGVPMRFQAPGAAYPSWTFGDGSGATGASLTHTYRDAGTFLVRLHGGGMIDRAWHVVVPRNQPRFASAILLNPPGIVPWHPSELQGIAGCG